MPIPNSVDKQEYKYISMRKIESFRLNKSGGEFQGKMWLTKSEYKTQEASGAKDQTASL